jgi:hypothetical protein
MVAYQVNGEASHEKKGTNVLWILSDLLHITDT